MARFLKDRTKSQGAAPGSLIFIGNPQMTQNSIQVIQYTSEKIEEFTPDTIESVKNTISNDHMTWINISGLQNTKLIANMGKAFDISSLFLEDILNTDQRPRFSEESDHLYIIAKSFYWGKEDGIVHMEQLSFIIGSHYLISIQETDTDYFKDVKKRLYDGKTRIRSFGTDYLCYTLLDTLADNYIINLEILGAAIEERGKTILEADAKIIKDLYHYKTELSYIRKNVRPFKEVTTRFTNCDSPLINQNTYTYLHDLDDLAVQAQEAIEIYYSMVSDQINLYQTNIGNRQNDVMKVLTIFSAIFIPLTFIAGIYGMNFEYIPELQHHYAYFILWGIMIVITITMLLYFKRKRWL